ncbi:MAG TPA: hypothetical protein VF121_04225, partial [Thermoanaerobaculia bacterium]|nr:hypothetical protein [Thermoanaerobaculia bacterium]
AAPAPTAPAPETIAAAAPSPPPAAAPEALDLGSLGAAAAGRAATRTLRRPGFWIAVAALAAAACWLFLR